MPRLFVAIIPSSSLHEELSKVAMNVRRGVHDLKANWVPPAQLHINLHFLDDIPQEKIELIESILNQVAKQHQHFSLIVSSLLGFPNLRRARVLALGIQPSQPLNDLVYDVQLQLEEAGVALMAERIYRPHVTLARIKVQLRGSEKQVLESFKYQPLNWPVHDFALLQSNLIPSGPIHQILQTFKLSA